MSTLSALLSSGTWKWREYTADGTFIVPTGTTRLLLFLQAAGGGGSVNGSSATNHANGGNGGDAIVGMPVVAFPGDELTIEIGAGGLGGTGVSNTSFALGQSGGDTTVILPSGTVLAAKGGNGGRASSLAIENLPQATPAGAWYVPGAMGGLGNDPGDDVYSGGGVGGAQSGGTRFAGGGGASFFGDGLDAGHDEAATTPEVWNASVHGYGGGGGGYGEYILETSDAAGAGAAGVVWVAWKGNDYGT